MAVRKVRKCTLGYTVKERNDVCGDEVVCSGCGWNEDEASRRKKELRLKMCEDGLWRMV